MLWKCCTQYANKFKKLSSGHRTGKGPFHSNLKERQCQKMFKLPHNCTHFTRKVILKIFQARLQEYVNWELTGVKAGFRKGTGTRGQTANICWITEKTRGFQENIYFCFTDYAKGVDCMDHNKLWKILKETGIPDHLTCLLRNLYAGQEATVRTDMEQWTGSKLGKEYLRTVYCHPAYLTLCSVHHSKCWTGWSTSWNQHCQEKYQ